MRYAGEEPEIREGRSAVPGVDLLWTVAAARPGASDRALKERLRAAADRMAGAQALALRHRDVVQAYRVFFRRIGIEPDERPTPAEAVALRRMREGTLHTRGSVADAITVAALETGVSVVAFDAGALAGDLRVEATEPPVVADAEGPLAVLFEPPARRALIGPGTARVALVAAGVPGVPRLSVEEALWIAWDTLA